MRVLLGIIGVILLIVGIAWGPIGAASRLKDGLPNQFDRMVPNLPAATPRGQITERLDGYRHYAWAFERARSDEQIRAIKRKIDAELAAHNKLSGAQFWAASPRILQTALSTMVILIAFGMALCFANATATALVGILAGVFQEAVFILPTITGGEERWFLMSALGGFVTAIVAQATAGRLVKRLRAAAAARGPAKPIVGTTHAPAHVPVNVRVPSAGAAKGVGSTLAQGRATPLRVAAPTITGNIQYSGAVVRRRPR